MSVLFLILALAGLWLTWNAARRRSGRGIGPLWFPALFTSELALFQAAGQAGLAGAALGLGWAGGWAGRAGLAASLASVAGLLSIQIRAGRSRRLIEAAASEVLGAEVLLPALRIWRLARPYPSPPGDIDVQRDLSYGPDPSHRFDLFRPRHLSGPAPVLLQVHGGGWTGGRRYHQARPLMHRMARGGWVVMNIDYRLSPRATFPDQLIDVKRAVTWAREHSGEIGADPMFVAVTGGSAGGQLAALAAVTAGDASLQPGFEAADTTVQVCVPLYGVHDLLDRSGRPKWPYLAQYVVKADPVEDPEAWAAASPIQRATGGHPPFLVLHGASDSLVGPGESRRLVAALREFGGSPVGHAQLPGATHGFDTLHSLRAERAVDGIQIVLEGLWSRHLERAGPPSMSG